MDRKEYMRNYYQKNKKKYSERSKIYRQKNKEVIAIRAKEYYQNNKINISKYNREWQKKNRDKMCKYSLKWRKKHPEKYKKLTRDTYRRRKLKAFQIISSKTIPECVNCGVTDLRLLEVNHKNLGGRKDIRKLGSKFYCQIVSGERKVDDLEVRCRVCNAYHYINKKFGVKYNIEYLGLSNIKEEHFPEKGLCIAVT